MPTHPIILDRINNLIAPEDDPTAPNYSPPRAAKIKKVPKVLRDSIRDCEKYFQPRVLFLGPFHKGRVIPKEATQLKQKAAKLFMENGSPDAADKWLGVYHSIYKDIGNLMEYYDLEEKSPNQYMSRDHTKILKEENAWMLFHDGCSAMYFICGGGDQTAGSTIKSHEEVFAQQDLFLLENQLPYPVLEQLMNHKFGDDPDAGKRRIEKFIQLQMFKWFNRRTIKEVDAATDAALRQSSAAHTHLLEYLRTRLVGATPSSPSNGSVSVQIAENTAKSFSYILLSASDLKARGIYFKANHSNFLTEVSFSNELIRGCLSLPSMTIDEMSKGKFLNLVADEMSSDIPNKSQIASYLCFLDSLMDNPKDAKILREAKIIHNLLGSDKELVELFNEMSANLVPDSSIYRDTQRSIQIHCGNRRKTWMAQLQNDYFDNPWTLVVFISAILVISLNMIQTYLTMIPPAENAGNEWKRLLHVLKHIYMPLLLPLPLLIALLFILFLLVALINLFDLRAYKKRNN